jgi:hypothetical protein
MNSVSLKAPAVKVTVELCQFTECLPGADLDGEAWEFARAMERFQRASGRRYPTWSEVLQVAKALGYLRSDPPGGIEP